MFKLKEMQPDESIQQLFEQRAADYLTIKQVRDGLPAAIIRRLELKKHKTPVNKTVSQLKAHLGTAFKISRKGNKTYLVRNISDRELIINKIRKKPNISSKQLAFLLPIVSSLFVKTLNQLFQSGELIGILNEQTHLITRFVLVINPSEAIQQNALKTDDKKEFEKAYRIVGRGKSFVRIHLIRDWLHWSKTRFDSVLEQLKSDLVIQLQGGDSSTFTVEEIEKSYIDSRGRLRLTVTWVTDD